MSGLIIEVSQVWEEPVSGYFLPNAVAHWHSDSLDDHAPYIARDFSEVQDYLESLQLNMEFRSIYKRARYRRHIDNLEALEDVFEVLRKVILQESYLSFFRKHWEFRKVLSLHGGQEWEKIHHGGPKGPIMESINWYFPWKRKSNLFNTCTRTTFTTDYFIATEIFITMPSDITIFWRKRRRSRFKRERQPI